MSEPAQLQCQPGQGRRLKTGLRFMEYRDLGIERATHGKFRAPDVLRAQGIDRLCDRCDFQRFYVLQRWIRSTSRVLGPRGPRVSSAAGSCATPCPRRAAH